MSGIVATSKLAKSTEVAWGNSGDKLRLNRDGNVVHAHLWKTKITTAIPMNTTITTIPAGFRPMENVCVHVQGLNVTVAVTTDGNVYGIGNAIPADAWQYIEATWITNDPTI
jgi:hypothetical protein